jgi:hypothetical protein
MNIAKCGIACITGSGLHRNPAFWAAVGEDRVKAFGSLPL